jgi:hypothetical protein
MANSRRRRTTRSSLSLLVAAAFVGAALVVALHGQQEKAPASVNGFFPNHPGTFENRPLTYDIFTHVGPDPKVRPEDLRRFRARAKAAYDLIRAHPVFHPPLGFQARAGRHWRGWDEPPGPMQGDLDVIFYYFVESDGKPVWGGEANVSFMIHLNPPHVWNEQPLVTTKDGTPIFVEPAETSRAAGMAVYEQKVMLLRDSREPVFLPATREQYLTAWLAHRAEEIRAIDARRASAVDPYEKWVAERPKRLKDQAATYERIKKTNPAQAETIRAQMEAIEAGTDAALKQQSAAVAAVRTSDGTALLREGEEHGRRKLAALTPEEREKPAHFRRPEFPFDDSLALTSGADTRPMVILDPHLYDPQRPRSDIQVITVVFEDVIGLSDGHIGRQRVFSFRDTFDWQTLIAAIREAQ